MLHCGSCGVRIGGDTGYYRHPDVCPGFAGATPEWPRDWHGRRDGKGYRRELYEGVVGMLLERVSLGADTLTRVVGTVAAPPSGPDQLALRRIEHGREAALNCYLRDRDTGLLERTMARLDVEEGDAKRVRKAEGIPADVAVRYLRDLARTWAAADGRPGRRMLAEALFERIDALGSREMRIRLTGSAIAHGFAAAVPERLDLTVGNGRGERI